VVVAPGPMPGLAWSPWCGSGRWGAQAWMGRRQAPLSRAARPPLAPAAGPGASRSAPLTPLKELHLCDIAVSRSEGCRQDLRVLALGACFGSGLRGSSISFTVMSGPPACTISTRSGSMARKARKLLAP
jgi:hypothetical protein